MYNTWYVPGTSTGTVRYVPGTVSEAFIFYMRNFHNKICVQVLYVHKQELSNQAKIDEHGGNDIT